MAPGIEGHAAYFLRPKPTRPPTPALSPKLQAPLPLPTPAPKCVTHVVRPERHLCACVAPTYLSRLAPCQWCGCRGSEASGSGAWEKGLGETGLGERGLGRKGRSERGLPQLHVLCRYEGQIEGGDTRVDAEDRFCVFRSRHPFPARLDVKQEELFERHLRERRD